MKSPRLLHDYVLGWSEDMRVLFTDVEAGRLSPHQARQCFTTPDGQILQSVYVMWQMLLGYRFYGQQTFMIGPRFREMLENTSLVGVPWEAIKWPYPFFYIALAECPHTVWGGPTGWHALSGIAVGFDEHSDMLTVYLWGDENEKARVVGDDASFWFNVPLKAVREASGDMETYLDSMMRDPTSNWADGSQVPVTPSERRSTQAEVMRTGAADEHTIALAKNALRIAINLCIYLQSTGVEQSDHPKYIAEAQTRKQLESDLAKKKSPGKKKRVQRDIDRLSTAHVTWLGRSIEDVVQRTTMPGRNGPLTAFWVRGHWWPRLDNHEAKERHGTRWVQPYQKYKDLDLDDSSRQYRVVGDSVQ